MLNSPYRKPYEKELNNNDSGRRKVVYIIIAVAVIAATIPLVMLLLKGWLSPANDDDGEVLVISNETMESIPATPVIPPAELPVTAQVSATDGFAPGASINPPDDAVPAIEVPTVAVPTVTAVPAAEMPGPAVSTTAGTTAMPANNVPVTAAVPAVAPPPPGVSVSKVTDVPPETPSVTAGKPAEKKARTFRPLTAAELAALKKANGSGKTNVSAADKRKYNEKLFAFVRRNWSAPSAASVNNRKLKAAITLTVAPDGTISNVKLVTPSYVNAMDDSVRTLIRNIQKNKAPAPGFNTGAIKIELQN